MAPGSPEASGVRNQFRRPGFGRTAPGPATSRTVTCSRCTLLTWSRWTCNDGLRRPWQARDLRFHTIARAVMIPVYGH